MSRSYTSCGMDARYDLAYLQECFVVDPNSPSWLSWKEDRPLSHFKNKHGYRIWKSQYAGRSAGTLSDGYYILVHKEKTIRVHRIVYALIHNIELPSLDIDHIDQCRSNNNPNNLRLVSRSVNKQNVKEVKGYYWDKRTQKWMVRIKVRGKTYFIGRFIMEEHAEAAYREAKRHYHEVIPVSWDNGEQLVIRFKNGKE